MEIEKSSNRSFAPEAELIRLARLGDEEAFRELFLTARDTCMGLAMSNYATPMRQETRCRTHF